MKITNKLNLPQPFVDAVSREYTYQDKRYSVTSILKGTCQTILERRHQNEIEQDVADMVWLIFGSAVHKILEEGKETQDQLKENRLEIKIGDYTLSGIFDLYDAKTKTVTDYKTASTWKVQFDDWNDYQQQTLIYAHMLRKIGFECDKGELVVMLKDHSKSKAKFDSEYPQLPVTKICFKFEECDFDAIELFLKQKFEDIEAQEKLADDLLIPCSPEERWAKPNTYAVKKHGRKSAVRVLENEEDANELCRDLGSGHYVEFRKGEDVRCLNYCNVCSFCPYGKELINE